MRDQVRLYVPAAAAVICCSSAFAQSPVQVFILAGQSNMEGKGQVAGVSTPGTLEYMVDTDPANFGHLVSSGTSNWITRTDVSMYSTTGSGNSVISGGLSVGFGSSSNQIGPELGFGTVIGDAYGEDVLIIKTAWGGKSLKTDFRPPSAVLDRGGEVGFYYNEIINNVQNALANIGDYVPGYAGQGYELKGFGWHQGWNDRVDSSATAEYEENMVDFINDIRFDLGATNLPFVIANTGIGGDAQYGGSGLSGNALTLANAQLGPANLTIDPADPNQINVTADPMYPEFVDNVKAVNTVPYWRLAADSPVPSGSQGFHWNQSGESYYLFGEAMGEVMATMSDYVQFSTPYIEIDQTTGSMKLVNPGVNTEDMDLEAVQITSAVGALDTTNWTPITGNYDGAGDGSVDAGNWTILSATASDLSEAADVGGIDGVIAPGGEVSFGDTWIQNPTRDIEAYFTDTDGNIVQMIVRFVGDEHLFADLNGDQTIDINDWGIFIQAAQADLSSLSQAEAYALGDLDGDLDNDLDDFTLFRDAYEESNPAPGAFQAMLAEYAVPEPSSLALLSLGGLALARRRRTQPSL